MFEILKEIRDSSITKKQKTMKNDQVRLKKKFQRAFGNQIRNSAD